MSEPTVLQAKRLGVYTCQAHETLLAIAQRMVDEYVSALVVVNERQELVGVISHTDLLRARLTSPDWADERVIDHMTRDVVTVLTTNTLSDATRLMIERQIHRVVVVRAEGNQKIPLGVISTADLVYHMVQQEH